MTYDAADGYVLLFGGCACPQNGAVAGVQSDTWKFANSTWSRVAVNASPPARSMAGLAYDASDGYVVLFGGQGSSGTFNDTWEYTNGGWSLLTPLLAPPWTPGAEMTYDGADNYVVLLSGSFPPSTWTFHAGAWTNLTARGDRSPDGPAANPIVYDSTDGYVLLFGTAHALPSSPPSLEAATWRFLGGNWSNVTGASGTTPPARDAASVADFPPGGFVLLFGGSEAFGGVSAPRNDTWAYSSGNWTLLATAFGPGPRSDMTGTFTPNGSLDVFYGGWYGAIPPSPSACQTPGACADTWTWTGGGVSTPLIQSFSAVPRVVDLGASTQLLARVLGGSAPFSYHYTGLPNGCTSTNVSPLNCTPSALGVSSVMIQVTDVRGHSATARTTVDVVTGLTVTGFASSPDSASA